MNTDTWTWPEKERLDIPGFQLVPAEQRGKRLLGIRIEQYLEPGKENANPVITVTHVNAGGSANGAVIGGGTIRYTAKPVEKGWVVELVEPAHP